MAEENINSTSEPEKVKESQSEVQSNVHNPEVKPSSISGVLRIVRSILLIIVGIWSITLSNKIKDDLHTGDYELSHSYGGDAYTGMQNASAQTSKNTMYTNEILCEGFGSILLIAGLGFISCGVTGFKKD